MCFLFLFVLLGGRGGRGGGGVARRLSYAIVSVILLLEAFTLHLRGLSESVCSILVCPINGMAAIRGI